MLSNVPHKRGCLGTWDYMCPARHRPAPVHGSWQQQDRYIPSLSIPGACFQREGERWWWYDMNTDFPRSLWMRAKNWREQSQSWKTSRSNRENASSAGLQGGRIVDQVIFAQEISSFYCTRYTQMIALYCTSNIRNLHMNARVFHLILPGSAICTLRCSKRGERYSSSPEPSFLSVWILVDKKGSEDCDVGHWTSAAANPILISEEQKARKGLLSGPLPTESILLCLSLHHFVLWADAQKE